MHTERETDRVKKGKVYRLKSTLIPICNDSFSINGNGAKVIIDHAYPVPDGFCHIFHFSTEIKEGVLFLFENISFECELGQKFDDVTKRGDTYFININNCRNVIMKNVSFRSDKNYNNLTFLTSLGSNVTITDCDIRVNTKSIMGGIFWLMNQNRSRCVVSISNSYFEHDTADETMCFSNANANHFKNSSIQVNINDCKFNSVSQVKSAGFLASYNMGKDSYLNVKIDIRNSKFVADGFYARKILYYDCGTDANVNYGTFKSSFTNCLFSISSKEISENGLFNLVAKNTNSIHKKNSMFSFNNCRFNIRNTWPIIGDKDGNRKGIYSFKNCRIQSNGRVFEKNIIITQEILH